jgi:homoserine O-acetyltransferase/O-succinyltransferase
MEGGLAFPQRTQARAEDVSFPRAIAAQGGTAMKIMLGVCSVFIALVLADAPAAFAHWPDQAPHQIAQLGEFKLEGGGVLEDLKMSFVTHGKLNAAKDNAILFQHGFALNHHQFDHMIGPGRPLDTDKYFIICPDALGETQTRFEHSSSPTNSGLKMKFPFYNGRDKVKASPGSRWALTIASSSP